MLRRNAILITAAGAAIVAGFMSASFAEQPTISQYPNNRANHHPRHQSVAENEAVVTRLGSATAVSYWAAAPDGWHVVTTVDTVLAPDTDAEQHATVRFAASLMPGQEQIISVPMAAGEPAQVLRIRRLGDRIEMHRVAETSM